MTLANKCRVCLSDGRLMYNVSGTVMQEMWEKLTNAKFNSNDGKPVVVCYICCVQLKKSVLMMKRALKAEELLTEIINNSSGQSLPLISAVASLPEDLRYNYVAESRHYLECFQFERNVVVKIKEENTEDNKELNMVTNEEENTGNQEELNEDYEGASSQEDIDIKVEEYADPIKEESQEMVKAEPSSYYSNAAAKNILGKELQIVLERIDEDSLTITPQDQGLLQRVDRNTVNGSLKEKKPSNSALITNLPKEQSIICNSILGNSKQITNVESQKQNNIGKLNLIESENTAEDCPRTDGEWPDLFKTLINRKKREKLLIFDGINKNLETNISSHIGKMVKKSNSNKHIRKDIGEKPYICNICNHRSARKYDLRNHIKAIHTNERNFSCHICECKFVTQRQLNKHLRTHTGEKPYKCDLCDYRAKRKENLSYHIKAIHMNERNFACQWCVRTYVTKSSLNIHLRTHAREKPYKCNLCEFKCSQKSYLKSHEKYIHTNERPFSCPECIRKFVSKSILKAHLRTHIK